MDGISTAVNVIGIIQLTGAIAKVCGGYIKEVKDAEDDIIVLQQALLGLKDLLERISSLLQSPNGTQLAASPTLINDVMNCHSTLRTLEVKLNPEGQKKNPMKRFGFRALKWPLKKAEVNRTMQTIERYKTSFTLSLTINQTSLIAGMSKTTLYDLGKLPIAQGAEFDSYENQYDNECLPGTRVQILTAVDDWVKSPLENGDNKTLFWLKGMAGTGKSTISRTVARSLKQKGLLAGNFFFKRGEMDRGSTVKFFPTIARQLSQRGIPELAQGIQNAVHEDPDVSQRSLKDQFEKLLLRPLKILKRGTLPAMVMVIDALDECDSDQDIQVLLQLLPELRPVGIRVFLTSRPENPVDLGFSEIANEHQDIVLHDIPEAVTSHDITLFLRDQLGKIKCKSRVPLGWPNDEEIEALVAISVPLFISAATVCRFVADSNWEPDVRLKEILEDQAKYATKMEKTYMPILKRLVSNVDHDEDEKVQLLQQFHDIVGAIVLLETPLSVNALSSFLDLRLGLVQNRLNAFRSVLSIPDESQNQPVRILHLSFRDFLVKTKSQFHVNERQIHRKIATRCFDIMRAYLKRNILDLDSYGTPVSDIDPAKLPFELQYSCRYWSHHAAQCKGMDIEDDIYAFLHDHFLHWMEAMCIFGLMPKILGILDFLQSIISHDRDGDISELIWDSRRFVQKYGQVAANVPLQIYTGLLFTPKMTLFRKAFGGEIPSWVRLQTETNDAWDYELQALEAGSQSHIECFAFSPDGKLLASGTRDPAIQIWNGHTGILQHTFEIESSSRIEKVEFSPDGQLLAVATGNMIQFWKVATMTQRQILHFQDKVYSIKFSPDGRYLVSTTRSDNELLFKLFETTTGDLLHAFEKSSLSQGCGYPSFAFSPDSQHLAVKMSDQIVTSKTSTGELQETYRLEMPISGLAYLSNGQLIVFGSGEKGVRILDAKTGNIHQALQDPNQRFFELAFSPDGHLIASVDDETIGIWDARTNPATLRYTVQGRFPKLGCLVFSPDSRILAATEEVGGPMGSLTAIKFWDVHASPQIPRDTREIITSLLLSADGHYLACPAVQLPEEKWIIKIWKTTKVCMEHLLEPADIVRGMTFSPDGRFLASHTITMIQIWDLKTGTLCHSLNDHIEPIESLKFHPDDRFQSIKSLAFSPDGSTLASWSQDNVIKLRDPTTGILQRTLFFSLQRNRTGALAFSSDGQRLAMGSENDTIEIQDIETGAVQYTFRSDLVHLLKFSPDDQLLACVGYSTREIELWDVQKGTLQQRAPVSERPTALEFTPDGSYLKTNCELIAVESYPPPVGPPPARGVEIWNDENEWIMINGQKALWLPPQYRPSFSEVKDDTVFMSHLSGQVSIMKFSL